MLLFIYINNMSRLNPQKAFTLIELLIVIGILAVLATTVLLVINPAQMVKQSRDANRITEINQINKALLLYQSFGGSTSMGTHGDVYISLPSSNANCSDLDLPALSSGSYHCATQANYRNIDGTGWIPVDLTSAQSSAGTLFSSLPIDPINTVPNDYYYTYIPGSWALSATMESDKYIASNAANDGGQSSTRFEMGNNIALNANLLPPALPTCGVGDTLGMISYWKFDGDAVDYFGSNNGTNNGAVSTTGKVGNALSFDGVNDYVLVPNSASLNPQQISISAWLYIKDTTWSYPGIIDKDGYYAGWKGYSIAQYFSTPSLIFEPWSPNDALISTNPLSTYQWNHVVITLGGGTFKMYINGVLDKNVATSGGISPLSTGALLIGSRATATGPQSNSYFNGFIDEVAIFDRVLSDGEILALYNSSNTGSSYCQ